MKSITTIIILGILTMTSIISYGQMGSYPHKINNLDLGKVPVTKVEVENLLGLCPNYRMADYSDEFLGIDEHYKYYHSNGDVKLYMKFTDGLVQEFYSDSPDYLFYGTIRVGDGIQKFRDMIANGFGKFFIEEDRGHSLKTIVVKLGDNTLRVTHNNSVITFILYQALF